MVVKQTRSENKLPKNIKISTAENICGKKHREERKRKKKRKTQRVKKKLKEKEEEKNEERKRKIKP